MVDIVVDENSYITEAEADTYFDGSSRAGPVWTKLGDTPRRQALITAQRLLERQTWQGEQTVAKPTQALAWPRTGVTDRYGNAVATATVPQQIKDAQAELAFELTQDTDQETEATANSNTKRVKADTVEVEYFSPVRTAGRFPSVVQELIAEFLAGAANGGVGLNAFGTDTVSNYSADDWTVTRGWP